ncbi:MAG: hypothetical protein RIG66_01880 [Coleofasciculus sp. E2-BRE-01]
MYYTTGDSSGIPSSSVNTPFTDVKCDSSRQLRVTRLTNQHLLMFHRDYPQYNGTENGNFDYEGIL